MAGERASATGSTFGFTIPVGDPSRPRARRTAGSVGARGGPLVVVIEDDRRSLDLLTLYLEGAGVEVAAVRDGPGGWRRCVRQHPAAVVLDIRLPGMDGWDVLAHSRPTLPPPAVPVVVVSMLDERGRGFALGAAEYLVKPVSREEVLSALTRVRVLPDAGSTLLAIDDDPLAVELVKAVLQAEGGPCSSATDGESGIAIAGPGLPAVILLDLLMPGWTASQSWRRCGVIRRRSRSRSSC